MLRIVVAATIFVLVCTASVLFIFYAPLYKGFYVGFEKYFAFSSYVVDGRVNCTHFSSQPNDGRCRPHSCFMSSWNFLKIVNYLDLSGCEVSLAVAAVAIIFWLGGGFILFYAYFLNILCLVHALILLYFANALLTHLKVSLSSCRGSTIIRVRYNVIYIEIYIYASKCLQIILVMLAAR